MALSQTMTAVAVLYKGMRFQWGWDGDRDGNGAGDEYKDTMLLTTYIVTQEH